VSNVKAYFLRTKAATALLRLNHRTFVRPFVHLSVCLSVCHKGGSVKNGAR